MARNRGEGLETAGHAGSGRERAEVVLDAGEHGVAVIARNTDDEIAARVIVGDEFLYVVDRNRLNAGDGAQRRVSIRSAGVDAVLQLFLAELLFVVIAQALFEGVELLILEALEIVLAE